MQNAATATSEGMDELVFLYSEQDERLGDYK